jgi:gliding-associated putative ABC transporter substrate-binding component GldG
MVLPMKGKVQRYFGTWTNIVVFVVVLVLVNLVAVNFFTRVDLTEGKVYTLSKASKNLVRNLKDKLVVKAYFSKDLPPPYNQNSRYLRDQLADYKAYGGGLFQYEFIDPGSEQSLEKEAQSFRIPPLQVNAVEKDKVELKKVYMGLVFLFEDKSETIPVVQSTGSLEYDITSTIKKITSAKLKKVGFLTGHGEPDPMSQLRTVYSTLSKNYEVTTVTLGYPNMVPDDVDVLLIIAPNDDIPEWDRFAIDQFLMSGGKAAFLVGKINADISNVQANKRDLKIDEWTKNYGFRINDNLVMDLQCGMINVQERRGFFTITNMVNYPFFPAVTNFSKGNPMVKDMESLGLFFVSSIDTSGCAARGIQCEAIASSSERSRVMMGRFDINPMQQITQAQFTSGPQVLAASFQGKFDSYFKSMPAAPDSAKGTPPRVDLKSETNDARIVVVGEGNFPQDPYLAGAPSVNMFMNIVDWLAQDEDLIQIRTRDIVARPLKEVSTGTKQFVKYADILGPSLLVILLGIGRWMTRRGRKQEW